MQPSLNVARAGTTLAWTRALPSIEWVWIYRRCAQLLERNAAVLTVCAVNGQAIEDGCAKRVARDVEWDDRRTSQSREVDALLRAVASLSSIRAGVPSLSSNRVARPLLNFPAARGASQRRTASTTCTTRNTRARNNVTFWKFVSSFAHSPTGKTPHAPQASRQGPHI